MSKSLRAQSLNENDQTLESCLLTENCSPSPAFKSASPSSRRASPLAARDENAQCKTTADGRVQTALLCLKQQDLKAKPQLPGKHDADNVADLVREITDDLSPDLCDSEKLAKAGHQCQGPIGPEVKSLRLPGFFAGCKYVTEGLDFELLDNAAKDVLDVPLKTFEIMSSVRILSGGTVFYGGLPNHVSIPNYYAQNPPIVVEDIVRDSHSSASDHVTPVPVNQQSLDLSCLEEDAERKVLLVDIFLEKSQESQLPAKQQMLMHNPYPVDTASSKMQNEECF